VRGAFFALLLVEVFAVDGLLRGRAGSVGGVGVNRDLTREAARPDTGSLRGGPIGLRGPTMRSFRVSKSGFVDDLADRSVERAGRPAVRLFAACVPSASRGVSAITSLLSQNDRNLFLSHRELKNFPNNRRLPIPGAERAKKENQREIGIFENIR
jgi:hypothetical protein